MCVLVRWAAICWVAVFALPAWACFPAPDAKPKHEISVLDLPQPMPGVVQVRFESEGYSLQAEASDLLTALSPSHMDVAAPGDLANALRSKMSSGQNMDTQELVAVLISDAEASGKQDRRSDPDRLTMRANNKLRFAFAKLLQERKVSVTEISSQRVLPQIKLDRFKEICHGGRRFTSPEDKEILYVQDWIS